MMNVLVVKRGIGPLCKRVRSAPELRQTSLGTRRGGDRPVMIAQGDVDEAVPVSTRAGWVEDPRGWYRIPRTTVAPAPGGSESAQGIQNRGISFQKNKRLRHPSNLDRVTVWSRVWFRG